VKIAALLLAMTLGQTPSDPYVRSRVDLGNSNTECLFWTVPKITWHQSTVGNSETAPAGSEFEAVRKSFQSWQDIFAQCGNLTFEDGGQVADREAGYDQQGENRNLVLFRNQRCSGVAPATDACWKDAECDNKYDCWSGSDETIAITLTTYDERTGIIYDSDIELNSAGFFFTTPATTTRCSPPLLTQNCIATDIQNTMTHEIGHLVGLDHTNADGSTMNPTAPTGDLAKRLVDSGSRDFVCTVYAKGKATKACIPPAAADDELGRKGSAAACASAGAGAWLPALAGWGLLLAVRRRRHGGRG
jgi:hypothetical protein